MIRFVYGATKRGPVGFLSLLAYCRPGVKEGVRGPADTTGNLDLSLQGTSMIDPLIVSVPAKDAAAWWQSCPLCSTQLPELEEDT